MASLKLLVHDWLGLVKVSVKESDMDLLVLHSSTFIDRMAVSKVFQLQSISTLNHSSTSFCFWLSIGSLLIHSNWLGGICNFSPSTRMFFMLTILFRTFASVKSSEASISTQLQCTIYSNTWGKEGRWGEKAMQENGWKSSFVLHAS